MRGHHEVALHRPGQAHRRRLGRAGERLVIVILIMSTVIVIVVFAVSSIITIMVMPIFPVVVITRIDDPPSVFMFTSPSEPMVVYCGWGAGD